MIRHLLNIVIFVFFCHIDVFSPFNQFNFNLLAKVFSTFHKSKSESFNWIIQDPYQILVDLIVIVFDVVVCEWQSKDYLIKGFDEIAI